jgi:hypothetical protein
MKKRTWASIQLKPAYPNKQVNLSFTQWQSSQESIYDVDTQWQSSQVISMTSFCSLALQKAQEMRELPVPEVLPPAMYFNERSTLKQLFYFLG